MGMSVTRVIDKWEAKKEGRSIAEVAVLDECIRDLKMEASGEIREPNRLDSICYFKKYKGMTWQAVIEENPGYVNWCYQNIEGFQLDEIAHNYLIEMGG